MTKWNKSEWIFDVILWLIIERSVNEQIVYILILQSVSCKLAKLSIHGDDYNNRMKSKILNEVDEKHEIYYTAEDFIRIYKKYDSILSKK